MTHHDDDPAFNEYLKRDSALSQRYKDASQEDVPPALDQKILIQARDAVNDRKVVTHPSWWIKWHKPLALAASLMLAFTVMYRIGHQPIERLAMSPASLPMHDKAAALTNAPALPATPQEESVTGKVQREPLRKEMLAAKQQPPPVTSGRDEDFAFGSVAPERKRDSPPVAGVPASAQPSMPVALAEASAPAVPAENSVAAKTIGSADKHDATTVVDSVVAEGIGQLPDRSVSESMQRIPGIKVDRLNSRDEKHKASTNSDPELQLQHIRDLRKQGKKRQADKAWEQFQKDFPDYTVAESDIARGGNK